jgi:hypothetical protein
MRASGCLSQLAIKILPRILVCGGKAGCISGRTLVRFRWLPRAALDHVAHFRNVGQSASRGPARNRDERSDPICCMTSHPAQKLRQVLLLSVAKLRGLLEFDGSDNATMNKNGLLHWSCRAFTSFALPYNDAYISLWVSA